MLDRNYEDPYNVEHDGLIRETDDALLFAIEGEDVWIPKSTVLDYDDEWLIVEAWIAKQKNLSTVY